MTLGLCGQTSASAMPASDPGVQGDTPASAPVDGAPRSFVLETIPVSEVPLGAFPYVGLPEGYEWGNGGKGNTRTFDRFPFWTGSDIREVEGRLFMGAILSERDKTYSQHEVRKNIEAVVARAGGVRVATGRIPSTVMAAWGDDIKVDKVDGLGDIYNNPVESFVIRRPDRAVWIHFVNGSAAGHMAVVETKPFAATARLLPAQALAQAFAEDGKAVIHLNFATDATRILPESRPQIEEIAQVLKQQPALRLAINGYTDETGSTVRNLKLSQGRAAAVRLALTAAGIDAFRLTAKGFGSSGAISDNATETGRARNRRVELVRTGGAPR